MLPGDGAGVFDELTDVVVAAISRRGVDEADPRRVLRRVDAVPFGHGQEGDQCLPFRQQVHRAFADFLMESARCQQPRQVFCRAPLVLGNGGKPMGLVF